MSKGTPLNWLICVLAANNPFGSCVLVPVAIGILPDIQLDP